MEAPNVQQDRARVRHPRRPPAHESVTLRHCRPLANLQDTEAALTTTFPRSTYAQADPPSLVNSAHSSNESSNADKWFERWNNDVRLNPGRSDASDSPFLLTTPSEDSLVAPLQPTSGKTPSHQHSIAAQLGQKITDDSSSDYRSVIDDLTIENQRLKKRLRRYEKLHNSHLQGEELFEVRTHGIPAEKKRELEETLRMFALSLATSSAAQPSTPQREHCPARLNTKSTNASNDSGFEDSAYVSMSTSGRTSDGQSRREFSTVCPRQPMERSTPNVTNIQSYLHDIPEYLHARHTEPMTKKAKQELVVRRLENIFAGRDARGAHQQPLQQQQVSESAALADRNAIEANGQLACTEGLREAPIMTRTLGDKEVVNAFLQSGSTLLTPGSATSDDLPASGVAAEQRPTRPLDLDPHRAQVATENLKYMRHLGFSPDPDENGQGWIYINLLINMAQLHTVNVTGDFVRKAVLEYSDKLEMSHNGKKLRWKGGNQVTHASSDASKRLCAVRVSPKRDNEDSNGGMRKRRRVGGVHSYSSEPTPQRAVKYSTQCDHANGTRLAYEPHLFQGGFGDEDYMSLDEFPEPSSGYVDRTTCSSRLVSHGVHDSSRPPKHDEGSMIFYNKAAFFTDLSGDVQADMCNIVSYSRCPITPVGLTRRRQSPSNAVRCLDLRGPLADAAPSPDPMLDDADAPSINLPPYSLPIPAYSATELNNGDFEASGIGGVKPCDHFAVTVQVRRNIVDCHEQHAYQRARTTLPHHHLVNEEIIATHTTHLPPSTLPQPSYFFTPDDDDDGLDDDSVSMFSDDMCFDFLPPIRTDQVDVSSESYPASACCSHASAYEPDLAEDEALDFLVTSREADMEGVGTREWEFDGDVAERVALDIPARSGAAAAGGGSVFDSRTRCVRGIA